MPMPAEEMIAACHEHTMWSWSAGDQVSPLAHVRAQGVYFWTADGRRFLDWNSQLMSVLIGHSHPRVIARMKQALDGLIFAHPGAATEARARVGRKLAGLLPGDLNTFFFTLGGAEANENAIKAARLYTGRHKILSRYRSYHGASHGAMMLTGDPRRLPNEPGAPGFVKVMDPTPYQYSFGRTPDEITQNHLAYLEEVLWYEGPGNIAAMFVEGVTGTNGILVPPPGWLRQLHDLLRKHGILLVCDEVMSGFGRTGRMFAFEHGGVVPDIVTLAKGLTSSYVPLGAMAVSDPIAAHFRKNVFYGGLTYNAHPFALETCEAVLDVLLDEDLVGNSARLGVVMRQEMDRLQARHPSIREGRCIGLFGVLDLQRDTSGTPMAPYGGSHPAMKELYRALLDRGLWTMLHWGSLLCNPPLCITEAQLREGFAILDDALEVTDRVVGGTTASPRAPTGPGQAAG